MGTPINGKYDVVVIGAGFSGAVIAERFASQCNKKVLVLEQRDHVGGNCFDYKNQFGVVVHKYGPHLFHTNKKEVWDYLSLFTKWHRYEHEVLASIDGQLVPLPFNLNTLYLLYPEEKAKTIERLLVQHYGYGGKVAILDLKETKEPLLKELATLVYEKFFVNYTTKQWGCSPKQISPAVTARVPVVISHDNRYFHDSYQAIPVNGYTKVFERILSHPNISVKLGFDGIGLFEFDESTSTIKISDNEFEGRLIFTGMLDQLFGYRFGELPYRSLKFDFETLAQKQFQPNTTVNYPNEHQFTRITEFKHILPVESDHTTIVREYPQDYDRLDATKNVPYYPVFNEGNQTKHQAYAALANKFKKLTYIGRLADYKYFNMDDAIANALTTFRKISNVF
ncbi:MAG: UDP-galactopyranose mutase [Alteromonadaceae bacterium]|nr:UDP-galactopyranose mutase [Alteromonadaceae bacterium]